MSMLPTPRYVGWPLALVLALASAPTQAQPQGETFPSAKVDYFNGMDGGIALQPAEVRGRNTWLMWTAGNQAFWD